MLSLPSQWERLGVQEKPRYSAFGGDDIDLYLEKFQTQYFGKRTWGKFDLHFNGANAIRCLAFRFDELVIDVNLRVGQKVFRTERKNEVNFVELRNVCIRNGTEVSFEIPEDVLIEMRNAAHVLPLPLIRIIANYCLDPRGSAFAICRYMPSSRTKTEGDLLSLPLESVRDPWAVPDVKAGEEYGDVVKIVNKNIITDLEWTPGHAWWLSIDDLMVFESPSDSQSEWIQGEFSGGLGRMHVGHFIPGEHNLRVQSFPKRWESRPVTRSVEIPNSVDIWPFEKKEAVNRIFHGCGETKVIARMFPEPVTDVEWEPTMHRENSIPGYLVFVERQNWCPLLAGGFPKAFGYNNILLFDEKRQIGILMWSGS